MGGTAKNEKVLESDNDALSHAEGSGAHILYADALAMLPR